jgi:hypothetical protein
MPLHVKSPIPRRQKGWAMFPEHRQDEVERRESTATMPAPTQPEIRDTPPQTVSADGSEETLFDRDEGRDYDLGEGD